MSYLNKNGYKSRSEYSVVYEGMRGVDFRESGSGISRNRFAYLENMYRDYDGDGAGVIESIPGYRKIYDFGERINGLYSYKSSHGYDVMVAHAGSALHEFYVDDRDAVFSIVKTEGIKDRASDSFISRDSLFVLDGENIFKLSDKYRGKVNDSGGGIYVPTTYYNGEEYEQRNLLTRKFYETYNIGSCESLAFATPSLKYAITDSEALLCKVTGISDDSSELYIPSRVLIGDKYYSVKHIEAGAFKENKSITKCYIANGISTIGAMAFHSCTSLKKVILPDSVTLIDAACFSGCLLLNTLHLGRGLRRIETSATNSCTDLKEITYSGSESDFQSVENTETLGETPIIYDTQITEITLGIKIFSPCVSIEEVTAGGSTCEFSVVMKGELCDTLKIHFDDKSLYEGKDVKLLGTLSENPEHYTGVHTGFITSNHIEGKSIAAAILGCTVAESFDGRIFLTGNPSYPGFTFFSAFDTTGENNPLYYGELNYFKDGVGRFANVALLATSDSIAVFKERDDGGGSIYYHTPSATGENLIPKIYPVSYAHNGFSAKGRAISFFDDPVFISERGLSALSKKAINLERSIATRSTNINPKLLTENLSEIKLAVWRGYLVLLSGERIYLADSRDVFVSEKGDMEYEWYFISGIGSRKNAKNAHRYSSVAHTGYAVHENADGIAEGEVLGCSNGDYIIRYVIENGIKYEVYQTEELIGGEFYPPTHLCAVGDLLFFATSAGEIYVFNSDKRGIAPPTVSQNPSFDKEEYEDAYKRQLHPYYYSFAGHAPRYALQTKRDDCSIPHLTKSTVKNSLTLKCRAIASGKIRCEVGTDNEGYSEICAFPGHDMLFADMDFTSVSMSTEDIYTVPVHEKSKNWIEKQITIYSDDYGSPFGLYTIAYRFFVKGKIKKNR
ncbi:MAG: leucine-rich repeat domain-containing protein [Clostridia bacterium]|nr:leucine-rich repeat domain-containing protein [Clostridia bacterium]